MIKPENRVKLLWDAFIILVTIIASIVAPLVVVFEMKITGLLLYLDIFVTVVFSIDMLLRFFTAVHQNNTLDHNPRIIAKKYLKRWFWIDLLATIPFDLLLEGATLWGPLRTLKILRLFRLLRLLHIFQTIKWIKRKNIINPSLLRLLIMVFWIAFTVHFFACGWVYITANPANLDIVTQYIRSLYWTITTVTTIGYGDITPQNNKEIIYVMIIQVIGAGMYGFVIANIANLITNIDSARASYREKMEKVNTFMKYRNIPPSLQARINDYYAYLWESRRGYDESSVLNDLPVALKTQVALFLNKNIIEQVPIFKGASQELIREIIMNLEPIVFTPGDKIVQQGEVGHDMFFISKGSVDVVSDSGGEDIVYATLTSGHFFGEIALLFSSPTTATIKARDYCDIYRLQKKTFDHIVVRYPDFEKQIKKMAAERHKDLNKKR